jgi:hypothetical protein
MDRSLIGIGRTSPFGWKKWKNPQIVPIFPGRPDR